jgi:hypothetical protein
MLPVCGPIVVLDPPQLTTTTATANPTITSTNADRHAATLSRAKDFLQRIMRLVFLLFVFLRLD